MQIYFSELAKFKLHKLTNYLLENLYPEKKFRYVEDKYKMDLRINAMGGATADINADGFKDIIGIGSSSQNVVYYRNPGN